jgi:nucleotide-binding universal stress UspA family protein
MTKVIAALDNSLAASPVLATALALGKVLDADVRAVHVPDDGGRVARGVAAAANVPLETPSGPVVERLRELGSRADVEALVIGSRGSPVGRHPLGATAMAVATSVAKPVAVVPPEALLPGELRHVLVPLQGGAGGPHTPRAIIELAHGAELEVVVLHVLEEHTIPAFTDQPQHEQPARAEEFLRRYCPWGIDRVRVEMRVGRTEEVVPAVASETATDIVALGWSQELQPGRAPIVRATLERCRCPVLLVPVTAPVGAGSTRMAVRSSR